MFLLCSGPSCCSLRLLPFGLLNALPLAVLVQDGSEVANDFLGKYGKYSLEDYVDLCEWPGLSAARNVGAKASINFDAEARCCQIP
jgi:hypothetical protein